MPISFFDRPDRMTVHFGGRFPTFPFRRIVIAMVLGCLFGTTPDATNCFGPTQCHGQDDLFGDLDSTNLFGAPTGAESAASGDDIDTVELDPLTKQLIEQSRRSDSLLAASVASLARTRRWAEVDQLLSSIADKKLSAAQAAAMASQIPPDVFFRIKQQPLVSDKAKTGLDKLGKALSEQIANPGRLTNAIEKLASDSVDERIAATRTLLQGGNAAVAALVKAAVSGRSYESRDAVLSVMLRLGGGGVDAIRQLALYGTPEIRTRAIEALTRIDADRFVNDWVTSLHAEDATDGERKAAASALARIAKTLPARNDAIAILSSDLTSKREIAASTGNSEQVKTVWSVGDDRASVTDQESGVMPAAYRDAVDAALRLRRVGATSPQLDASMLSASLGYRLVVDPDWGDASQVTEVRQLWGPMINGATILRSIDLAAGSNLAPISDERSAAGDDTNVTQTAAMIGLLRLADAMRSSADGNLEADQLLRSWGSNPTPLVQQAWSSPNAQVRYEAALLASRLGGKTSYPGSSLVRRTLLEMTRLSDRPTAIVVETRPEYVAHFERLLGDLGWEPILVQSVATLQRAIDRGGDLRLVLSKTQLSDLPPIEMVDLVRRAPRGGEVPIVFYDDDGVRGRSDIDGVDLGATRWAAPVLLTDPPVSGAAFDGILARVELQRQLPALSVLDRQRFRSEATEILSPPAQ